MYSMYVLIISICSIQQFIYYYIIFFNDKNYYATVGCCMLHTMIIINYFSKYEKVNQYSKQIPSNDERLDEDFIL